MPSPMFPYLTDHPSVDGAPGTTPDRIFISSGAEVKAFTKKGKQFLSFDSNLTEPIRSM